MNKIGVHALTFIGDIENSSIEKCLSKVAKIGYDVMELPLLNPDALVSNRATFIADPDGIIRFVSVTDLSVGRNPDEVLRVLDALQTDELCPCNWKKGDDVIEVK